MWLLIVVLLAIIVGASFLVCKILEIQDREFEKPKKTSKNHGNKIEHKNVEKLRVPLNAQKDEIVRVNSKKVRGLIALNESVNFHNIRSSFKLEKFYDNKMNFLKIDPAALMAADMRQNIEEYAKYIEQVRENRAEFEEYQQKIDELLKEECSNDFDSLEITPDDYYKRETRIFNELKLKPVIDCAYGVRMSYSSPSGRVNLYKTDLFNFDDMFACFESVSRSYLDRDTYKKLSAVERGEVSDSLRYDILNRDNFTCVLCGASARQGARLHVDHIIPISKGGKSTFDNLRTLCERCNVGKSNKMEGAPQNDQAGQDGQACQWCGGKLVLRQGKNGEFYGCSNYPQCRYTKSK
jgi:5-methylcytosine-specific restriction endonuclease McrA